MLAWGCAVSAQAPTDIRVALVIGNSAYPGSALANPVRDAQAMGERLRSLGFMVIELHDAQKDQILAGIARAGNALQGRQGVGLMYYAGHGLQLDWRNYMVPVDARLSRAADVAPQTVDIQTVIDAFRSAATRINILVLDACRDSPFGASASGKGLAQMDAPPGTLLAYSTAPGNVAEDGDAGGGNGLYTRYLLDELRKPAARIEDVFKRVRLNVRKASAGRQVPWESTSMEEDFYFDERGPARPALADGAAREVAFMAERQAWDAIKNSSRTDDLFSFLQKHPSGFFSELAQFRLDRLSKVAVAPQPGRNGVPVLGSEAARYKVGMVMHYSTFDPQGNPRAPQRLEVTAMRDGKVFLNGGTHVWDEMGNLITDSAGTRTPGKLFFPADLSVGKKWHNAYESTGSNGGRGSLYWDFRVTALEEVKVPAGVFLAYKVEGTSKVSYGATQVQTYWVDPKTMLMVKDIFSRSYRGQVDSYAHRELFSVRQPDEPS